jgi:hypothetical protein
MEIDKVMKLSRTLRVRSKGLPQGRCPLCGQIGGLTKHHLVPKSQVKAAGTLHQSARICSDCHIDIHHIFTNEELAAKYNTLERLKEEYELRLLAGQPSRPSPEEHGLLIEAYLAGG